MTWIPARNQETKKMVLKDGAGASGASIIENDVVLCLLIAMTIISLFEMAVRLVAIAAMPVV
jgi:hypothetical protein